MYTYKNYHKKTIKTNGRHIFYMRQIYVYACVNVCIIIYTISIYFKTRNYWNSFGNRLVILLLFLLIFHLCKEHCLIFNYLNISNYNYVNILKCIIRYIWFYMRNASNSSILLPNTIIIYTIKKISKRQHLL